MKRIPNPFYWFHFFFKRSARITFTEKSIVVRGNQINVIALLLAIPNTIANILKEIYFPDSNNVIGTFIDETKKTHQKVSGMADEALKKNEF